MKVREGKTFIEFKDDFGWTTRVQIRKNSIDIKIKQTNDRINRYTYLKPEETKLFIKKLNDMISEQGDGGSE